MIPDVDVVKQAMIQLERKTNENGWDQDPILLVMLGREFNKMLALAFLSAPVQPAQFSPNAGSAMAKLGQILLDPASPPLLPESLYTDFAGLAFMAEGWSSEVPEEERGGRMLADIPGSDEVRMIHAIDCKGRYYHLERYRSRDAVYLQVVPDDGDRISGTITDGLRDMMMSIWKYAPFGLIDIDAVAKIGPRDE